jgi:hypothetical protein
VRENPPPQLVAPPQQIAASQRSSPRQEASPSICRQLFYPEERGQNDFFKNIVLIHFQAKKL